jgi:hypothetical protein
MFEEKARIATKFKDIFRNVDPQYKIAGFKTTQRSTKTRHQYLVEGGSVNYYVFYNPIVNRVTSVSKAE